MIDTYLNYLQESELIQYLYHGSHIQGLKILSPKFNTSRPMNHKGNYVYAAENKKIASGFTFSWTDADGIKYGGMNDILEIQIPKRLIKLIKKPCSLYKVDSSSFIKANTGFKEYISKKDVKVLDEEKYRSAEECMKKNGLKIKII